MSVVGRGGVGSVVALGATVDGTFTAATTNRVVTTLHVVPRGCVDMSFGFCVASGAGVGWVVAGAVRPTVWDGGSPFDRLFRVFGLCRVGSVETCLGDGEVA